MQFYINNNITQFLSSHANLKALIIIIVIFIILYLFSKKIFKFAMQGIIVIVPIILLFEIFVYLYSKLTSLVSIVPLVNNNIWFENIFIFIFLISIGWFVKTKLFDKLSKFIEEKINFIKKIPIVNIIFNFSKKMLSTDSNKNIINKTVLVKIDDNTQEIGFTININMNIDTKNQEDKDKVWVFIPSIPIPTSGRYIWINKKNLREIDIDIYKIFEDFVSIEDSIKNISIPKK